MARSGFDLEWTGGLPDEALFALLNLGCGSGWGKRKGQVTAKGVARIEYELGLKLPWAMAAIAGNVPGYGSMFCVIEGDENHYPHILEANRSVKGRRVWPQALVVFANWGDGMSLCWDRSVGKDAEHLPVLWCEWNERWDTEKDEAVEDFNVMGEYAANFRVFAEEYAVYRALRHPKRSGRKVARRILEELK